jgi:hypothetical protein
VGGILPEFRRAFRIGLWRRLPALKIKGLMNVTAQTVPGSSHSSGR